jgi:hypothetical protein
MDVKLSVQVSEAISSARGTAMYAGRIWKLRNIDQTKTVTKRNALNRRSLRRESRASRWRRVLKAERIWPISGGGGAKKTRSGDKGLPP